MKLPKLWPSVLAVVLMFPRLGAFAQSVCSDVSTRGNLNVLTINLDFAELQDRQVRLERIAEYAKNQAEVGTPIDLILMQEVVGGALAGTANSSADLKQLLAAPPNGLAYNLSYHLANGIPGVLTVGNAILSRCAIVLTLSQILPFVNEQLLPGVDIPLNREVMLVRISIPNVGKANIYNTHLCADCTPSDRLKQVQALLGFIRTVEYFFPGARVLGGDFNTDLNISGNMTAYSAITGVGFSDSFLVANANHCNSSSCCVPDTLDVAGCTYAVDDNPYANRPPFSTGPTARIDYIFIKNSSVHSSNVIFPPPTGEFVSDHSAVLSTITLH